MKNPIVHHLLCLLPFIVLLIGIEQGWVYNGAICIIWIFIWGFIWIPLIDYRRLKILKIANVENMQLLQRIKYAYSCRFKYPKRFFFE